jgi:hypothetical protein
MQELGFLLIHIPNIPLCDALALWIALGIRWLICLERICLPRMREVYPPQKAFVFSGTPGREAPEGVTAATAKYPSLSRLMAQLPRDQGDRPSEVVSAVC